MIRKKDSEQRRVIRCRERIGKGGEEEEELTVERVGEEREREREREI